MQQLEATIALVLGLVVIFSVPLGVWIVVGRGLFDTVHQFLRQRGATLGSFVDEVAAHPGGETLRACIQCGTCSGSCPAAREMQYSPRQINAMVKAGMKDEVLSSNSMWMQTIQDKGGSDALQSQIRPFLSKFRRTVRRSRWISDRYVH